MDPASPVNDDTDDDQKEEDDNRNVVDDNDDGSMNVFQQSVLASIHDAEGRRGGSFSGGQRRQSDIATSKSGSQSSRRTQPPRLQENGNSNSTQYNTDDANASSSMMSRSTIVNDNTLGASRFGWGTTDNEDESRTYDPNHHRGNGEDYGKHQQQRPKQSKQSSASSATSLFGAVMRQFGNNSHTNNNADKTDNDNGGPPTKRPKTMLGEDDDDDEKQRVNDQRTAATTTTTTAEETNMAPLSSPSTMFTTLSHTLGSPVKAGRSLMSLLKGANSPFKFRSPQLMKNKKKKNKQMPSEDAAATATSSSSSKQEVTKTKNNRGVKRRLELDPLKNPTDLNVGDIDFVDHSNEVDHKGGSDDDHEQDEDDNSWVELPIFEKKPSFLDLNYRIQRSNNLDADVSFLDWSVKTRVRLEWHSHDDGDGDCDEDNVRRHSKQKQRIIDPFLTQNLIASEQWKTATTYYEFQTTATIPRTSDGDLTKNKPQTIQRRNSSTGGAMRIGSANTQSGNVSRHSFGDNTSSVVPNVSAISSFDVAKDLVRKVQGSKVQFSRQLCMDGRTILQPGMLQPAPSSTDDNLINLSGVQLQQQLQQQRRQWQQAFRSLHSNFCKSIQHCSDGQDLQSSRTAMLDTFFYCVGEEHVVVFRAINEESHDMSINELAQSDIVPAVMISDCSSSFRQKLLKHGGHLFGIHTSIDDTDPIDDSLFDLLYDAGDDRNLKENKSYPSTPSPTAKKKKNAISPSTKADLEALRRARVFGESAGADVFVKIKNGGKEQTDMNKSSERNDKKAICFSGWDQVGLFFETYLNTYGDVLCTEDDTNDDGTRQEQLPAMFCPHWLGPFSNCTEKQLGTFPVPNSTTVSKGGPNAIHAIDVCGMILPTAIRQMILSAGRVTDVSRSFRRTNDNLYLVLHTFRGKNNPLSLNGLRRSFVFNQSRCTTNYKNPRRPKHGDDDDINDGIDGDDGICCFECPAGKVLQLAVWDNGKPRDENDTLAFRLEDVQTSLLVSSGPRRRSSI